MAQISPRPLYHHDLTRRVVEYLHTGDSRLFPFTAKMDPVKRAAFARDLRDALSDLVDSGSARKTSATGNIVSDRRIHEVVEEWRAAGGGWPAGADPHPPEDDAELAAALVEDELNSWRFR
jgi:hypothetical protein